MVVNDLIKTLDRVPLQVAKHPVGLDSVTNILIHKLNSNLVKKVIKIEIWGIGGIGKTTVAKAIYNQIHRGFDAASFVSDVRATTTADWRGLINLQMQILKDLTKNDEKVNNVDEGLSLFKDRLERKRVLLILDDVDAVSQLNALVGDWLAPGSRVIITSRDKGILIGASMPPECIYEMNGLDINKGLQLFSWHAFLRASPNSNFKDLSTRIVEACKGHPLSLEVIGSFLYAKQNDIGCWTETLQNITLNPEIHQRLYISYSGLSNDEKEIFVDIACFFIGEHKRLPIIFWKSLYNMVEIALSNLSMKLLIKIDDKGAFDMHDHLRDLGRTIGEEEKQGNRLWKASHLSTLSNNINVSRLRLNGGNLQRLEMLYRPGIRYLHLQNVCIEGMTEDTRAMIPPSLVWLRLQDCTFAKEENTTIGKILRAIKKTYRAQREKDHSRSLGNIKQLKIMQLTNSNLDLRKCKWLNKLPDAIGNLSELRHLDLSGCAGLNKLPDAIGNLLELQHLDLRCCRSLNKVPDSIGNLSQLQHLDLSECTGLNKLPDSIGNLSDLQHLDLSGCAGLNELPCSISNLSQLEYLNLEMCRRLRLRTEECNMLNELYATGKLSQLQTSDFRLCWRLNRPRGTFGVFRY